VTAISPSGRGRPSPLKAWSAIPEGGYLGIVAIYALSGPDGAIRYIGQARDPLKRLVTHRCFSATKKETPLSRWLKGMKSAGQSVTMTILEWSEDGTTAEMAAIARHRAMGCDLLNVQFFEPKPPQEPETFRQLDLYYRRLLADVLKQLAPLVGQDVKANRPAPCPSRSSLSRPQPQISFPAPVPIAPESRSFGAGGRA
jgi:hypothetical protein